MHEAMIAENIIETVLAQTKTKTGPSGAGKITRIVISCGQINAVNDESLQFAFEVASVDTICKGAKLKIKHIPLKGDCRNCKNKFEFDLYNPQCPKCGKSDFSLGEDAPLLLEEIEFEEEEKNERSHQDTKARRKKI